MGVVKLWLYLCLVFVLGVAPFSLAAEDLNCVANAGFEDTLSGWNCKGAGISLDRANAYQGKCSLHVKSENFTSHNVISQVLDLTPIPVKSPIQISTWGKANGVEVVGDYRIRARFVYYDGTKSLPWDNFVDLNGGTHDWQNFRMVMYPDKPVKSVELDLIFNKVRGEAWFDDVEVSVVPFKFEGISIVPNIFGEKTLSVTANTSVPAAWNLTLWDSNKQLAFKKANVLPIVLDWDGDDWFSKSNDDELMLVIKATDDYLGREIIHKQKLYLGDFKGGKKAYAAWAATAMERVMPHALPNGEQQSSQVDVSLAANEYESFQIVLRPEHGRKLTNVKVTASDLVCDTNQSVIRASNIDWKQVGYVKSNILWKHPDDPDGVNGWWPDPLLDVPTFDVAYNFSQPVWLTVYAPPGTKPGVYHGTIMVKPEGEDATEFKLAVKVYGFELPVTGHLKTAFAVMDGFLEYLYGKPVTAELRQQYGDLLIKHRLDPDDITRSDPPVMEDLLHYKDKGLKAFNVVYFGEHRGDNRLWYHHSPAELYTDEYKENLIKMLDPYVEKLRQNGLADKAYFYSFDEHRPGEFDYIIREYFGLVKERYPEIPTFTTARLPQDPKVLEDLNVDWLCIPTVTYRLIDAEKCWAAGKEVWAYVCAAPLNPYANFLATHPLIESRVIWWQCYTEKLDGFLYWHINNWMDKRVDNNHLLDPAEGPLFEWSIDTIINGKNGVHADGLLAYPGEDGPIGSIRLANIRDGLEDYEYIWKLSSLGNSYDVCRKLCEPVTSSFVTFTYDPAVLYAQRDDIASRIESKTNKQKGE